MKLQKLRLKGWIGIKRGTGLDQIEVDFTGKSGLIAFDGQNGSGKSTCLELLSAYTRLASRDGSFSHHVYGRDAERELSFSYAGNDYRSLIKIDSQSEKQEGFIWKNGKSEVNGKITAYNKYIKDLLGSPELFYASVFCSQNSKKLSDMRTGELKDLFAEFLRLDRLQGYETTAKQAGNIISGKSGQLENRLSTLQTQVARRDEIEEQRFSLGDKLAGLVDNQTILRHDLENKKKEAEALKETVAKNSVLESQKTDLQRTIDRMAKDMAVEKGAVEAELNALRSKQRELSEALRKVDAQLADRESIMLADDQAKQAQATIDELMPIIDEISLEIEKKQAEINAFQSETAALRTKLAEIKAQIKDPNRDPEIVKMRAELSHLRSRAVELDKKDPTCKSTTCSFIKGALEAAQKAPALYAEINAMAATLTREAEKAQREFDELQRQITEKESKLHDQMKDLKAGREALAAKMNIVRPLRESLPKLREKALLASEIIKGEQIKVDLEARIAEIEETGRAKSEAWTLRSTSLKAAINSEHEKILDIFIDEDAQGKLEALQKHIEIIEKQTIPDHEKKIQAMRDEVARAKGDLDRIAEAEAELELVKRDKDALNKEVSDWRYIQTACGKNGLQALEIDGAAPLITHYANDLLSEAFGPVYSVRLRTQDEEGKECLDIITIGEDGDEILLENLSGGQKVWNLMALRLAMTVLSKEKSGHNFLTGFADEMDGALDPENALNFVSMYRSFMKVGGFEDFFFISHRPECRNMADNVLKFEFGKNPFWG